MILRIGSLAALLGTLVVLAAGCGKSKPPTTAEWADQVCGAFATWKTSVAAIPGNLTAGDLAGSLQTSATELKDATQTLTKDLKSLETPSSPAAEEAQDTLDSLSGELSTSVDTIQKTVDDASGVQGTLGAVTTLSQTLLTMGKDVTTAVSELGSISGGSLQSAFSQAKSCVGLGTSS